MYDLKEITDKAVSAGVLGDIKVIFPFDLSLEKQTLLCEGIVAATDSTVYVIENSEIVRTFEMKSISEFELVSGIGCIFIEVKRNSGESEIMCRGRGTFANSFTKIIGDLKALKNGTLTGDVHKYVVTGNACPKCGRPLIIGSDTCGNCSEKGSYVKRILKIASPWKWQIIISVLLYFAAAFSNLLLPFLNKVLVDDYINAQNPVFVGFIGVILSIFAANVIVKVIVVVRNLIVVSAGAGILVKLRQMTFDKIQSLSIAKIYDKTAGSLIHRVSSDTEIVGSFITADFGNIAQTIVMLVTVGAILFVYDWRIALLVLCPLPLILILNRKIMQFLHKFFRLTWTTTSKADSVLHDTFSGIRVVKSYGMEQREIKRHDDISAKARDVSIKTDSFSGIIMPVMSFILGIGEFFILYYVGNMILKGRMTLGEMSQFSAYVSLIYDPLRWISNIPRIISRTGTSAAKIFEILDEENEIADKEDACEFKIDGEIEFDDVSFSYDPASPVIKHLSASIKKGEMIGIVGRSGVGKSTLINLVMRMYDPSSGSVKIDGHDIRDMSQACLRSQIGVVLQETYLFSGSVYDNIRYAKPDATLEEVIAASKLAGAHKFIVKLPDGYNTKVGEKGYTLSGGERQRVSIARALLRDPAILILDEATSALDTETEKEVQDVLYELTRNRTTLAIAHRLSTLRNADRILVIDKGALAEFGSHDELMKQHGIYYGLIMAQRQMSRIAKK